MIFENMNPMMDWGPNGWIILILGGALFLFFVIILLYYLVRRDHKSNLKNSSDSISNGSRKSFEKKNQSYDRTTSVKENQVNLKDTAIFCPNCGEKLDEKMLKFCPFCGSEL